jgi:hypothetical protein
VAIILTAAQARRIRGRAPATVETLVMIPPAAKA